MARNWRCLDSPAFPAATVPYAGDGVDVEELGQQKMLDPWVKPHGGLELNSGVPPIQPPKVMLTVTRNYFRRDETEEGCKRIW